MERHSKRRVAFNLFCLDKLSSEWALTGFWNGKKYGFQPKILKNSCENKILIFVCSNLAKTNKNLVAKTKFKPKVKIFSLFVVCTRKKRLCKIHKNMFLSCFLHY